MRVPVFQPRVEINSAASQLYDLQRLRLYARRVKIHDFRTFGRAGIWVGRNRNGLISDH